MEDASYDHLVPNDGNHLGNIVLACGRCNEYEQLNTDWEPFFVTGQPHRNCMVNAIREFLTGKRFASATIRK